MDFSLIFPLILCGIRVIIGLCPGLQGLYNKFRESGYRAQTMRFPLVFVTGGWSGECV